MERSCVAHVSNNSCHLTTPFTIMCLICRTLGDVQYVIRKEWVQKGDTNIIRIVWRRRNRWISTWSMVSYNKSMRTGRSWPSFMAPSTNGVNKGVNREENHINSQCNNENYTEIGWKQCLFFIIVINFPQLRPLECSIHSQTSQVNSSTPPSFSIKAEMVCQSYGKRALIGWEQGRSQWSGCAHSM